MISELEARYLTIDWLGPGEARTIEVSEVPIRIQPESSDVPELEIQIFPDDFSWLGIRSLSKDKELAPRWVSGDGEEHTFIPVQDAQSTTWWVPAQEWVAKNKRHHNAFSRSLGEFKILIDTEHLLLRTITHDCSRIVLEDYLRGFKDELIWLVFGFDGAGTVTGGSQAGEELVAALGAFTEAMGEASRHLATQFRERTREMPRHKLRPNTETFRSFARNPSARYLPSRVSMETADLPDNRYLRHMAQQCSRLLRQMLGVTQRQALALQSHAQRELERADQYERIEYQEVDPEVFDAQLGALESKLDELQIAHRWEASERNGEVRSFPIKLGNRYAHRTNQFFYVRLEASKQSNHRMEPNLKYSVVEFPEKLARALFRVLNFSKEYVFEASPAAVSSSIDVNSTGGSYRLLKFESVSHVEPKTSALENKRKKRSELKENGWRAALSRKEKQEYQHAASGARKRAQVFSNMAERAKTSSAGLTGAAETLRRLDAALERRSIGHSASLPRGMRFSMNSKYAACLKAYRRVRALMEGAGVDEDALERVEKIGTLHASAVYERWCLVKMLGVLISEYGFEPPADWQARLIGTVTGLQQSLGLELCRPDIGMTAHFEYQPKLANGRRPDFRLQFFYGSQSPKKLENDPFDADLENRSGLIMDAKFRTRWRPGELQGIVDTLVEQKQYNLAGDRVFVIHPVAGSICKPSSPLEWARDCDYGQSGNRNHQSGSVWLSPSVGLGDEQRHLRRLIDLQLQANFGVPLERKGGDEKYVDKNDMYDMPAKKTEPTWCEPSFCISCGMRHAIKDVKFRKTKAGNRFWDFNCQGCGMTFTRTHCYSCGADLFKNHTVFTYHDTIANQPTHVICPKCGSYFDADWEN